MGIRIGIIVLAAAGVFGYFHYKGILHKGKYAASTACKECHEEHFKAWAGTLHPKMFRPVASPGDILGDFEHANPAVNFKKEEIQYVIGNRWEQVYVRMIDGEYYPFTAKWLVRKKEWEPYLVNDWKETQMSKKCNGCHTTGFDPATLKFSEFGIGCEACHGAGGTHIINRKKGTSHGCTLCHKEQKEYAPDIVSSPDPAICGQCHSRGIAIQEEAKKAGFEFPVNFKPGSNLHAVFHQMALADDKKGKFWWGNGFSKNRHQEFADWEKSKHSQSLTFMTTHTHERKKTVEGRCLLCHSGDYHIAQSEKKRPTVETAKFGVTCVVCHEPHGMNAGGGSVRRPGTLLCGGCHIDSMTFSSAEKKRPHYPCPQSAVTCQDCHMPYVGLTGGAFTIRSHAFQVIPPAAAKEFNMPSSCQNGGCHADKTVDWAIRRFGAFYGKPHPPAAH